MSKTGDNRMNRYQKIITLSIEDMATFLSYIQWDSSEPSADEMLKWLMQDCTFDDIVNISIKANSQE